MLTMFDTITHPDDLLEVPRQPDEHRAQIALLRQVAEHTRIAQDRGDKELADHGRALGRLSEALGLVNELTEAITARDEALVIWQRLGRQSAEHLTGLKLVDLHDRDGNDERVDHLLEALTKAQAASPDTLGRAYGLTRQQIQARVLARRGEHTLASALLDSCIEALSSRSHTPLYTQLQGLSVLIKARM